MKITDYIGRIFARNRRPSYLRPAFSITCWEGLTCLPFGELVFQNAVELLSDLDNDVTFELLNDGRMTFAEFVRFFEDEGEAMVWRVYRYGFAVVGARWIGDESDARFVTDLRLLNPDEWEERQVNGDVVVRPVDPAWKAYVVKSPTYRSKGLGDWDVCRPAIEFLDNTLNASNTSVKKLGAFVVASPETPGTAPAAVKLSHEDKEDMERQISTEYGLLSRQRQVMLLPRGMKFQTISLTNIDNRLLERVRLCVELIADRMKIPASQIAVIDATAGKSLANGGEVHEGDSLKYKTYERLLNKTFIWLARQLGLQVNYRIYNKPADAVTGETITEG